MRTHTRARMGEAEWRLPGVRLSPTVGALRAWLQTQPPCVWVCLRHGREPPRWLARAEAHASADDEDDALSAWPWQRQPPPPLEPPAAAPPTAWPGLDFAPGGESYREADLSLLALQTEGWSERAARGWDWLLLLLQALHRLHPSAYWTDTVWPALRHAVRRWVRRAVRRTGVRAHVTTLARRLGLVPAVRAGAPPRAGRWPLEAAAEWWGVPFESVCALLPQCHLAAGVAWGPAWRVAEIWVEQETLRRLDAAWADTRRWGLSPEAALRGPLGHLAREHVRPLLRQLVPASRASAAQVPPERWPPCVRAAYEAPQHWRYGQRNALFPVLVRFGWTEALWAARCAPHWAAWYGDRRKAAEREWRRTWQQWTRQVAAAPDHPGPSCAQLCRQGLCPLQGDALRCGQERGLDQPPRHPLDGC